MKKLENLNGTSLDLLHGVLPGAEGDRDHKSLGGLVDLDLLGEDALVVLTDLVNRLYE